MIQLTNANIDLPQTFPFQGMGRSADDGEVAGPQVSEHPLPLGRHKEGRQKMQKNFDQLRLFLVGPTRVGQTRPA